MSGPQKDKRLPQSPFTGQFFLQVDILVWCLFDSFEIFNVEDSTYLFM
jgi:hypothetical protein